MTEEGSSVGKSAEHARTEKVGFRRPRWRVVLAVSCVVAAVLLAILVPTAVVLARADRLRPVCPAGDGRDRVAGEVVQTAAGYRATLRRLDTPTMYGEDAKTVEVLVEMQEQHRLHVKVWSQKSNHLRSPEDLKSRPSPYGGDVETLEVVVEKQKQHRLHVKIVDPASPRYEVPEAALRVPRPGQAADNPIYGVTFTHRPFSFKVTRRSTGAIIFDSSVGKLTFSAQFLSVSTRLASSNLYGLGEHVHRRYRHDLNWKTWPIFASGANPFGNYENLYGHHPFYMCLEDDGKANGVMLLNSNAMDVTLQPGAPDSAPILTYRVIGGVLDFYMFLGPSRKTSCSSTQRSLIGRPVMPAYWGLGFQLCRWNYTNTAVLREVIEWNRATGIPYDVQYGDIDYMEDRKDFTYDEDLYQGLPDLVQDLHDHGQKYIIILDPAIINSNRRDGSAYLPYQDGLQYGVVGVSTNGLDPAITNSNRRDGSPYLPYQDGLRDGVFVKAADGETNLIGEVWPGTTLFPDYTNPSTTEWWSEHCQQFHNVIPYDGLWIDMNEPKSFMNGSNNGCESSRWNYPPYKPAIVGSIMYDLTLCMDAQQSWGKHYDVHSLYGHSMAIATRAAMSRVFPTKRGVIITRSSFPGTGHYAGHWLGSNKAAWEDMAWSIPGPAYDRCKTVVRHSTTVSRMLSETRVFYSNKAAWEDMVWSIPGKDPGSLPQTLLRRFKTVYERASVVVFRLVECALLSGTRLDGLFELNMFGIPYVGADICGFLWDTTEQLCQRWMQLGAFYPFSRNHNHRNYKDQDPAVFSQAMIESTRDVMMTRYTLLPYLYTLFYHAHVTGATAVRPLLHEFPTDSNTWDVDRQFLWGSGLLISPVLTPVREHYAFLKF
ncbi:hypothetical protein Bbelb_077490 [Branchiostoma belcheri]|nr:hypothetical protein Bbelb_077490 [Branchiostoma belcheri]